MKHFFWFAVCCMSVAYASAAEFHVSPDGSDENPATAANPVHHLNETDGAIHMEWPVRRSTVPGRRRSAKPEAARAAVDL